MRYVGRDLVLRLQNPPSAELLEEIREGYADLLVDGTYEQSPGPLPAEAGELPHLARLRFHFNRRNMGRLRQLVDHLNQKGQPGPAGCASERDM
jgi:hypothetical protein